MSLDISSTVKHFPDLPYEAIKDKILGRSYQATLVFLTPARARRLNLDTRQKTYIPNVLSFPLDKKIGEVYITPAVAKKEAKGFELTYKGYLGYLFIHGLLHLKGLDHGNKMDREEQRLMKFFKLN